MNKIMKNNFIKSNKQINLYKELILAAKAYSKL